MLDRREFIKAGFGVLAAAHTDSVSESHVMTVRGAIPARRMGITLPHEHVLVDFIGADKVSPQRYDSDEVFNTMLPLLKAARAQGIRTFVDCTPKFLGRDVRLLRKLSTESGLHILTNTGLYKEPYLPPYAFSESADQLAARWIMESAKGINGSGIKPGFIKIAVNPGSIIAVQQKIVRAAARTSLNSGLVIACHTGNGPAALETLEILRHEKLPLDRYIFVHAEGEEAVQFHRDVARSGGWVEYDAVGWRPIAEHVKLITAFLSYGHIDRLLISQDAGWYKVGEKGGGDMKPFTRIKGDLIPALEKEGLTRQQRDQILITNPMRAFAITSTGEKNMRNPRAVDNWF